MNELEPEYGVFVKTRKGDKKVGMSLFAQTPNNCRSPANKRTKEIQAKRKIRKRRGSHDKPFKHQMSFKGEVQAYN